MITELANKKTGEFYRKDGKYFLEIKESGEQK